MRGFDERQTGAELDEGEARLETPDTVGFRAGMTSAGVIGRKLGKIYTPPVDAPKAIGELASIIDCELERPR